MYYTLYTVDTVQPAPHLPDHAHSPHLSGSAHSPHLPDPASQGECNQYSYVQSDLSPS